MPRGDASARAGHAGPARPSDDDYRRLLDFRAGLRRFLHWSEEQAREEGVTPGQHQLLLAIRGHDGELAPTVGEIAEYLVIRHHSAVGLIDRAAAAGLVAREPDPDRHGTVRVALTPRARDVLDSLSALHLAELTRLAPTMEALWRTLRTPSTAARGEESPRSGPPVASAGARRPHAS